MIKFPAKVKNLILTHLSVSELLELSVTCSSWYFAIGSSETFKERVEIKLNDEKGKNPIRLNELETCRDYENVEVVLDDQMWNFDCKFLSNLNWKRATIIAANRLTSEMFCACLKHLSRTVTHLSLKTVGHVVENDEILNALDFPFLESLSVTECSSSVLKPFRKSLNKLETLKVDFIFQAPNSIRVEEIFQGFADLFVNLAELELLGYTAEDFSQSSVVARVTFQLKKFAVSGINSVAIRSNIKSFIKSQGQTLEQIKLIDWDESTTIFEIWDCLPRLQSFYQVGVSKVFDFTCATWVKIKHKDSMEKLHFHSTSSWEIPVEWIKTLILASPFLKEVHLHQNSFNKFVSAFPASQFGDIEFKSCDEHCEIISQSGRQN